MKRLTLVAALGLLSACATPTFPDGVECDPNKPRFYLGVSHRLCSIQMEDYARHQREKETRESLEEMKRVMVNALDRSATNLRVFRWCQGRGTVTRRSDGWDVCSDPEVMEHFKDVLPPLDDQRENELGLTF